MELFIGDQTSQWIWKEKKEVWKYQRVLQGQSSKLVGGPVPEASKIGLGLVKIPKLEVRLACAFFVWEVVSIFVSAVESFVKLLFQLFFK